MGEPGQSTPLSQATFVEILTAFQVSLWRFIESMLDDGERAREITQDVFVDAWHLTQLVRPPFVAEADADYVRRWLYRVAYNKAISELRRRARIPMLPYGDAEPSESDQSDDPGAGDRSLRLDDIDDADLRNILEDIPKPNLICYALNVVYGFTAKEIALILDLTEGAVAQRIRRVKCKVMEASVKLIPVRREEANPQ